MTDLQKELLDISEMYSNKKSELDALEREYNNLYAQVYLQERILGMKTEEMRKNEMIRIMENEYKDKIDKLQTLKGEARYLYYRREALVIILGGKVTIKE